MTHTEKGRPEPRAAHQPKQPSTWQPNVTGRAGAPAARRAFDRVVDAVANVTGTAPRVYGGRATARCPAHADRTPSLSVAAADGKALLYCHGGCRTHEILAALGLSTRDLFDETDRPWRRPVTPPRPVAPPPDPGWAHVSEPPDAPAISKLALWAAVTTETPHGHYRGRAAA